MNTANYNMGTISEYAIKNFWSKLDKSLSAKEVCELYKKFYEEHANEINESVEALVSRIEASRIDESFLDDIRKKAEEKRGKAARQPVTDDDGIPDEPTTDDLEKALVNKGNAKNGQPKKIIRKFDGSVNPTMSNRGIRAYRDRDEMDINYMADLVYKDLVDKKYPDTTIYDKVLPYSTWNVSDVTDFTAVFAFKDLPNVDLSQWDVSHGRVFEGMFYKSTFNNDSIMNWKLPNAVNFKNMFIGSEFNNSKVIENWKKTMNKEMVDNGNVPLIGRTKVDDSEETSQRTIKRMGNFKQNFEKIKKYNMQQELETIMDEHDVDLESNESKKYVMDSSDFIAEMYGLNEGIIGDFAKKSFNKIKDTLETVGVKLKNGFVFVIDKLFKSIGANLPENIVKFVKKSNMKGVYAEIGKPLTYPEKSGYYGNIDKDSQEYKNYLSFLDYVSKSAGVKESVEVNERRVGLGSKDVVRGVEYTNIETGDIDTDELKTLIGDAVDTIYEGGANTMSSLIIWGAPGIGKTTIPDTIIKEMNKRIIKEGKSAEDKMSLVVIDCSLLQAGDLNMPMPVKLDKSSLIDIKKSPIIKTMLQKAEEEGKQITDDELMKYLSPTSSDAPKTWLPAYQETSDDEVNRVRNDIANGQPNAIYDDNGRLVGSELRNGGGIILFDEFLRGDPSNLFPIANLMLTRKIGQYKMGSKWFIMGCSNRPTDDAEVMSNFRSSSSATFNRMQSYNFIPDFKDWCKWAKEDGGFDDFTLAFISATDPYGNNSRWHNIDPEYKNSNYAVNECTPRRWSQLVAELNKLCKKLGKKSYLELGSRFKTRVKGFLPPKLAECYIEEYELTGGVPFDFNIDEIVEHPDKKVNGIKAITLTTYIQTEVRGRWSIKDPIPPKYLEGIIRFLENNISNTTASPMVECIAKIIVYCGLTGVNLKNEKTGEYVHKPESEQWEEIITNFLASHPELYDAIESKTEGKMW